MLPFARFTPRLDELGGGPRAFGLLIALAAALAACGGSNASGPPAGGVPASTGGTSAAAKPSSPPAAAAVPSASVIGQKAPGPFAAKGSVTESGGQAAIQATDVLQWQPNVILAKAGDKVTLSVQNSGNTAHTFLSPAMNVNQTDIPIQKTTQVEFSAPSAPGAYQFWCNIPGHAEAGMVGEVIVQ